MSNSYVSYLMFKIRYTPCNIKVGMLLNIKFDLISNTFVNFGIF